MKKILIIGSGFAGFSAAMRLRSVRKEAEVVVVDKNKYFSFLPLLPDVIGRRMNPDFLVWPLEGLMKFGVDFINEEVAELDLNKKEARTKNRSLSYDYLLIACGSLTNFYGNEQIRKYAFKLDDPQDARGIALTLKEEIFSAYLIAGGGYTGIEIAAALRVALERRKIDKKIFIVERAPAILGPLPLWMRNYVLDNLRRLNIEILTNNFIENIEQDKISLSSGATFRNAMLIWAAGVKAPVFIQNLNIEKTPQGRIKVDEYLRFTDSSFAAGDAANFISGSNALRMAVQFSISEGELAAGNIIRAIRGLALKKYRPLDLGYVIPMANNRSCGKIMGVMARGAFATFLHYSMCVYRSIGLKNKLSVLTSLSKGGVEW